MDLLYKSRKLGKICNDKALIERHYTTMSKKLMQRLDELRGAVSLADFETPALQRSTGFHPLAGKRKGQYAFYTKHPFRLIIIPIPPTNDLKKVSSVKIVEIENYH